MALKIHPPTIPFLFLLCLWIRATNPLTLNLQQSTSISWTHNNKPSMLILYNTSYGTQSLWYRVGSYPSSYAWDAEGKEVQMSDKLVHVYRLKEVWHTVAADYYYGAGTGDQTQQGVLKGRVKDGAYDPNASPQVDKDSKFGVMPTLKHDYTEPKNRILFMVDQNPNTYEMADSDFSGIPQCDKILAISKQFLEKRQSCPLLFTAQQLIKFSLYDTSSPIQQPAILGDKTYIHSFNSGVQNGFKLLIDSSILGNGEVKMDIASDRVNDYDKITISVKNLKDYTVNKVTGVIENKGDNYAFLKLDTTQGQKLLASSQYFVAPKKRQTFTTPLLSTSPLSFKVASPLTNKFYYIQNPDALLSQQQEITFVAVGLEVEKVEAISPFVFVGIGVGILVILVIVIVVVCKRRQLRNQIKLDMQNLKGSVNPTPSEREFVEPARENNLIRPFVYANKEKSATSATLDSDNHSFGHETSQGEPSERKVPSLEDKLEQREEIQVLPLPNPRFRSKHRRLISTEPILPQASRQLCDSYQLMRSKNAQVQKLEDIKA